MSTTGRSTLSAGAGGAASNMTDYGFNGTNRTVGGYLQNGAIGFATGSATSLGANRLGSLVTDSFDLRLPGRHVMPPEPSGRHVFVPEHALPWQNAAWNSLIGQAVDRPLGAVGAVANDVFMGKDPGDYMKDAINGAVSGAGGPTAGVH